MSDPISSHIFSLSARSRRLLRRNQHKEYQDSIAGGDQAFAANTKHTRWPRPASELIRLWDPVTFFPPEIALMCLRQALPSGPDFPVALISLTSVSSKWQQFLFSASGLWAEIHVRYSAHDLLAIISLFLHLSAAVPLNLIVWNTLGSRWEDIKSLLLPHTDRIHGLALGDDPPIYDDSPYAGAAYLSLVSNIFNSLHRPPHLVSLDFGCELQIDPSQLQTLDLTSGIHVSNTISVSLQSLGRLRLSIVLRSGMETQRNTLYGASILHSMPSDLVEDSPMLSDFFPFDSRSPFDGADGSIGFLNSIITFLVDILTSLDCRETATQNSASSLYMNFVDRSGNRCRLCNRQRGSLSTVLGCVRFHFGLRPFRCPGCRTCNDRKGFARFCTLQLLLNHIGPTTCAVCGTQQSEIWEEDIAGDPNCSTCQPTRRVRLGAVSLIESGGDALLPADMALFKSQCPANERIHWQHPGRSDDSAVSGLLFWVQMKSYDLAALAIHKYVTTKSRGALVSNADYRPVGTPDEPAFDWMTFEQARRTLDRTFQEGIAVYDPSTTFIVYIFLVSPSGDSVRIWSRNFPIPEELRTAYAVELAQANAYVLMKPHVVAVER